MAVDSHARMDKSFTSRHKRLDLRIAPSNLLDLPAVYNRTIVLGHTRSRWRAVIIEARIEARGVVIVIVSARISHEKRVTRYYLSLSCALFRVRRTFRPPIETISLSIAFKVSCVIHSLLWRANAPTYCLSVFHAASRNKCLAAVGNSTGSGGDQGKSKGNAGIVEHGSSIGDFPGVSPGAGNGLDGPVSHETILESISLEEIRAWGSSFDRLMKNAAGRNLFNAFLKSEYSEENIAFWTACEQLKRESNPKMVEEKAKYIYNNHISTISPKEVSLDSRVRDIVEGNMKQPTPNMFDEAQMQIYTLMHRDSYPRFVNSEMYRKIANLTNSVPPSPSSAQEHSTNRSKRGAT